MVPLHNIDTLDTVLTCSLRVYPFLLPVIWTIRLYVDLCLEDSKFVLLYKLHIDYSKIYSSFICVVWRRDTIFFWVKCEGCTHFWEILYVYSQVLFSQVTM